MDTGPDQDGAEEASSPQDAVDDSDIITAEDIAEEFEVGG